MTILKAEACDFLSLDNNVLFQNLDIFSNDNSIETENKVIEKIISMKSLKEVRDDTSKIKVFYLFFNLNKNYNQISSFIQ